MLVNIKGFNKCSLFLSLPKLIPESDVPVNIKFTLLAIAEK